MPEETPPPVRQRNTTPYVYNVAETKDHPAFAVLPGETAAFPTLLDGWTEVADGEPESAPSEQAAQDAESAPAVEEPAAAPEQSADEPRPRTPSKRRSSAAETDGGESR